MNNSGNRQAAIYAEFEASNPAGASRVSKIGNGCGELWCLTSAAQRIISLYA